MEDRGSLNLALPTRDLQARSGLPLRLILVAPFLLQIFAAVGLTGYLTFRNSQQAIDDLATQLQAEVSTQVKQRLDTYLEIPVEITQMNAEAIRLGLLDLKDLETSGHYFWKQLSIQKDLGYIGCALKTGEFIGAGRWLENDKITKDQITIDETSVNTQWQDYTYGTNDQGKRTGIVDDTDYDPYSEPWYTETVQAKKPIWTQIYAWDGAPQIQSVAFSSPIYNSDNTIIGVINADLLLSGISDF